MNRPSETEKVSLAGVPMTLPAVGRLLADFAQTVRRPFVTLEVIVNPDNINATIPNFLITGHSDDDSDLPAFNGTSPTLSSVGTIKPSTDMNDDIPF